MNQVHAGSFLTLHYRLAGPDGIDLVSTFNDKPATLSLGCGALAPAMEARLLGLSEGAREAFHLEADEAFGPRNPALVQRVAHSLIARVGGAAAAYSVGDVVQFPTPDGLGSYAGVVREVDDAALLLDFNHPLAGRAVTFEVQLIGVL